MNFEAGSLFPRLHSLEKDFTRSEKKVVEAVLDNPEEVLYSSITDLAEKAGVGDTTVVRFCRKVGFKGYQDFKMFLAGELSAGNGDDLNILSTKLEKDDDIDTIIQKIINTNMKALKDTAALLNTKDIEAAVSLIEHSRSIYFYGSGISGHTAADARNTFLRVGLSVNALNDPHMQAMSAALLTPEDLAIAISHSGSSKDTIETLRIAKESGAKTICITHYSKSPITKYADIILLSGHKEGPLQGGALTTKIAQMFVIDILYTEYCRRNPEKAALSREKAARAVSEKLY